MNQPLSILEYETLQAVDSWDDHGAPADGGVFIHRKLFDQLRQFDERRADDTDKMVFNWNRSGEAKAKYYVGVIQIPGLTVEILPKIQESATDDTGRKTHQTGRNNLLWMLAVVEGFDDIRVRDLAGQRLGRAPLSETLIALFADRLTRQFQRGVSHDYVQRRENQQFLRGKLIFSEHIQRNTFRRDRFFVAHEEFLPDTLLNRIFKAACQILLTITRNAESQKALSYCLMLLDRVANMPIDEHHFDRLVLTRRNRRFEPLLNFCRIVLCDRSPTASAGDRRTFSLLFNMWDLFEKFMIGFIRRFVLPEFENDWTLYTQGDPEAYHLLWAKEDKTWKWKLKPDLLLLQDDVQVTGEEPCEKMLVIDTKWKKLNNAGWYKGKPSSSDAYQMFAYARRFGARRNVLLYPQTVTDDTSSVEVTRYRVPTAFAVPDKPPDNLQIQFIEEARLPLPVDLRSGRDRLRDYLVEFLAVENGNR